MRISQAGIIFLIAITVLAGTSCNYYNRVIARKNLVDGAQAYKDRKYDVAETLFRDAVARDEEQTTAQLFLARTLHSQYASNRGEQSKAEQAIEEYKKYLEKKPDDSSSFKAVANLYENLGRMDDWKNWVTQRAANASLPPEQRAEAYTSLAAKENTCANDITDVEPVKKTVQKDGKSVFVFSKPANPADFENLKGCVQRGSDLINKALALDKNNQSVWSYKTSLLIQEMRLAEMEGRNADRDRLKAEADAAKEEFTRLAEIERQKKEAEEARRKAEEEERNAR